MNRKTINRYLMSAILLLTVTPLFASYWLLDEVLNNAINLALNPQTEWLLQNYIEDLKTLRSLNPSEEAIYKSRFLEANDELLIYQQPTLLRQLLRDTYLTYFLVLFIALVSTALFFAIWLNRSVSKSYTKLYNEDLAKAERLQELRYFDQWQTIASKLAHEINNPLTPIEMMMSNLPRVYQNCDAETFKKSLDDTQAVISEEVYKLKEMVRHFSQFSKLPEPVLSHCNLADYCIEFIQQYRSAWQNIKLDCINTRLQPAPLLNLDKILFNQCLLNLINNASQANPDAELINVKLIISVEAPNRVVLEVFNNGRSIAQNDAEVIFNLHYSSKSLNSNQGLGLAIVKKIVLDHGGDIVCLPTSSGARFQLSFPLCANNNDQ